MGIAVIEDAKVTYNGTPNELRLNENATVHKKAKKNSWLLTIIKIKELNMTSQIKKL
jgi:hypothetical protein